jgi:hypothetical protein
MGGQETIESVELSRNLSPAHIAKTRGCNELQGAMVLAEFWTTNCHVLHRVHQADSSTVERPSYTGEAVGSIPAPPTNFDELPAKRLPHN